MLRDVDGNEYIDFSSGIYVTTLGPLSPKDQRGDRPIRRAANELPRLHNAHQDGAGREAGGSLPGDLSGFQFYDSGTTAVEAGMRVMRAATQRNEMISCFYDYHGKTYGGRFAGAHPLARLWRGPGARLPHGASA